MSFPPTLRSVYEEVLFSFRDLSQVRGLKFSFHFYVGKGSSTFSLALQDIAGLFPIKTPVDVNPSAAKFTTLNSGRISSN